MTAQKRTADNELLIVRTFDAPPSVVFALWSSAEHMKRWMGPKNFTCPEARVDFRVGGTWRDEPGVQKAACLPRVALIDRIAGTVEQIRPVEVSARVHGTLPIALDAATPENCSSGSVDRLQLQPDVECVDGAARKKVTHFPCSYDDIDAGRGSSGEPHTRRIERRSDFTDIANDDLT